MNSATFLKTDSTTQGSWQGVYGGDGYTIEAGTAWSVAYAIFSFTGNSVWTWAAGTTDARALQNNALRIASCWYGGSFNMALNIIDGGTHQVAIYCCDWDSTARKQTVTVVDAATQAVLTTQSISAFNGGIWLVYNISGSVIFKFACTGGSNAVIDGVFFGPAGTPPVVTAPTATVTANPTTVTAGTAFNLSWSTTGATSATMNGSTTTLAGSQNITPLTTTTYTLVATGSGGTATASVTVTVTQPVVPANTPLGLATDWPITPDPTDIGATVQARFAWDMSGPDDDDVNQGQPGDCYLLAVMRYLCHVAPERMKPLVVDLGDGTFIAQFVDSLKAKHPVRTGRNIATFADRPDPDGTAGPAILEKCYCYYRTGANTYASLNLGDPGRAMQDLGMASGTISFSVITAADLYTQVKNQAAAHKPIVIGTNSSVASGWVGNHAYGIVPSATGPAGTYDLLNPWGVSYDLHGITDAVLRQNASYAEFEV